MSTINHARELRIIRPRITEVKRAIKKKKITGKVEAKQIVLLACTLFLNREGFAVRKARKS